MEFREATSNGQSMLVRIKLDLIGWFLYGIGFLLSIYNNRQIGAGIAAIGLILVTCFYYAKPQNDLLKLAYKTREIINITLLLAFALFLFLFKFAGLAIFCLGLNFFLFGCLSLKGQKIYVGSQWRLQDRSCYEQNRQAGKYWLYTGLFLGLGYLCLVMSIFINKWFSN